MNLPTDLLRTFVAIADLGGFTRAGQALGRSQPAISLQLKRLEDLIGRPLLQRHGRQLTPTDQGAQLLTYARRILSLNDEAVSALVEQKVSGHVRLGIPNEFAVSVLPTILAQFSKSQPDVTLEVICDLSKNLLAGLCERRFDIAVAIHDEKPSDAYPAWTERIVWVASPDHVVEADDPVALIVAPEGCVYRQRMINTLTENDIRWRIVYTSTSYGGTRAAAIAGLGVTAVAESTVPEGLRIVDAGRRFPPLAAARVSIHSHDDAKSEVVGRLIDFIVAGVGIRSALCPLPD